MSIASMINKAANQISNVMNSASSSSAYQVSKLYQNVSDNNAYSASQAAIQRDWQEKQNAKAMEFNASEAAKNRNWQEMMSNTAHQREIRDLQAAGLNPVLSAMGGNGAAVTSGATASGVTSAGAKGEVDMSLNSALVNLLGSVYNRTTQLEAANINARTQEAVAEKYNATSEIVAQIGANATKYAADRSEARATLQLVNDIANDSRVGTAISSAVDKARNTAKKVSNSEAVSDLKSWYQNSKLKDYVDKGLNYIGLK